MTLGMFLAGLLVLSVLAYFGMGISISRAKANTNNVADDIERFTASCLIVVLLVAALAARPLQFGVDSITYYRFYDQYCFASIGDLDFSYRMTFGLVNIVQAGACNSGWLATTWIAIIMLCLLCLPVPFAVRIKLAALALFSLIGIELATNALRQGLSAGVMMLAFALFGRHRLLGIVLAAFAVSLHFSTALVLVAVIIAYLPLQYFVGVLIMLVSFILSYSILGLNISVLDRLTGEISKYAAHDSEDLYIRIIAAIQLFVPVIISKLFYTSGKINKGVRFDADMSLKISLTALPYLTLPYFGYRYIYGIYMIVLYLCRHAILDDRKPLFEIVLIANAMLVLAWALGSSYVSTIPFVAF